MRASIAAMALSLTSCAHDAAPAKPVQAAQQRCTLRFVEGRLLVDGAPSTASHALDHCTRLHGAVVYVDDHSQDAAWHALEADLRARSVHIYVSGRTCDHPRCGMARRVWVAPPAALHPEAKPVATVPQR